MNGTEARKRLVQLHLEISNRAQLLATGLPGTLSCRRGCADCCVDELTVFSVEADLIRFHHPELLHRGQPHAAGACAFLGAAGECRIYEQRPYVCRTQGLPLRWQQDAADGSGVELRDICPLNEEPLGLSVVDLAADQCWTVGEFEGRLASLQAEAQGSFALQRESLRGLFGAG